MPTSIYTLSDPTSGEVRYVGKTARTIRQRFNQHLNKSKHPRFHSQYWIHSLLAQGLEPVVNLLEVVPNDGDWEARECYWITTLLSQGVRLTNHREGGQGPTGWNHSEETKQRISQDRIERRLGYGVNVASRVPPSTPKPKKGTKSEAWYAAINESNRGSNNGRAKITEVVAQQIKLQAQLGQLTYQEIADIYGVSRSLVGMIRRGDRWPHLPNLDVA